MSEITLQDNLLIWFRKNKRQLPWRGEKNWYYIWISEVMLQQTQVETVIPYYQKFIKKFNSIEKLSNSSQEEVLKIWEGLGYYTRARNLHRAAKIIVKDHNATLPSDREELQKIPGFGPYTTNAVLSLAFNQPHGVVDGNVKRVLARHYVIKDDIRDSKTGHKIQGLMDYLLPIGYPGEFNEAMMELGATICTSKSPLCLDCPISNTCQAYMSNLEGTLPFKSKKAKIPTNQSLACIIYQQNLFLIAKRPQHKMLAGLWEFPILTTKNGNAEFKNARSLIWGQFNLETSLKQSWPAISHSYTHFHPKLKSKLFETTSANFHSDFYNDYKWLTIREIKKLPLHKAMLKLLNQSEIDLETVAKRYIINT